MKLLNSFREDFYTRLGGAFFFFFSMLSFFLYKETTINYDYSYELTRIINGGGMLMFRWGSAPWRLFAFIGPYIGISLKGILLMTSFLFIFIKFGAWFICHYVVRNTAVGILVIITAIAGITEGFYVQGFQAYNAIVYFCLFLSILTKKEFLNGAKSKWIKLLILLLLAFLIKNTYIVILTFCIFFTLLELVKFRYQFIHILLLVILSIYFVSSFLFLDDYESGVYKNLLEGINSKGILGILPFGIFYLKKIVSLEYLIPIVLFVMSICLFLKEKKYVTLLLSIAFIFSIAIAVFFLFSIYIRSYPYTELGNYFVEGTLYSLICIQLSLFIYSIVDRPTIYNSYMFKYYIVGTIIFYTSKVTYVGIAQLEYDIYINSLMESLKRDYDQRIFIINNNLLPKRYARLNFTLPFESALKSSLNGKRETVALYATTNTNKYKVQNHYPVFVQPKEEYMPHLPFDINNVESYTVPFNPYAFYKEYNQQYFYFTNYDYVVLSPEYMDSFNKIYGFSKSER